MYHHSGKLKFMHFSPIPFFPFVILIAGITLSPAQPPQPQLLFAPAAEVSLTQIRNGIRGVVKASLIVNDRGEVQKVQILSSAGKTCDSIACNALLKFRFSPLLENGNPVSFETTVDYDLDPQHILRRLDYPPSLTLQLIDKVSRTPIPDIPVILQCTDTTADKELQVPFSEYMKIIGNLRNQKFTSYKQMITKTDNRGKASFYFLPTCSLKISIEAPWYTNRPFRIFCHKDSLITIQNALVPHNPDFIPEEYSADNYTIIVTGVLQKPNEHTFTIEDAEAKNGITNDLNTHIYFSEISIIRANEKPSCILVHGQGPYDNLFLVNGISMFAPVHFTNNAYFELSPFMTNAINKIEVSTNTQCGNYSNASGSVIQLWPDIVRLPGCNPTKSQLAANFSIRYLDLNFIQPIKHSEDNQIQVSYRFVNRSVFKLFDSIRYTPPQNYGNNYTFSDWGLNGKFSTKKITIKPQIWFATDKYRLLLVNQKSTIPWGVASIEFSGKGSQKRTATIGMASQNYYEGKQYLADRNLKEITRRTIEATLSKELSISPLTKADMRVNLQYLNWNSGLFREVSFMDSSISPPKPTGFFKTLARTANNELHLSAHAGISRDFDHISVGSNILFGSFIYKPSFFIDPGIWSKLTFSKAVNLFLSTGTVSSLPDIRGIPDPHYRSHYQKTYFLSSKLTHTNNRWFEWFIDPFIRYRPHTPMLDTAIFHKIWVPDRETPLLSTGADISVMVYKDKNSFFSIGGSFSNTKRIINGAQSMYEYDIPWNLKSQVHLSDGNGIWNLSASCILSAGLPYYDYLDKNALKRQSIYLRPDFSIEYHSRHIIHRYLRRFDAYFTIINFTDFFNSRLLYNQGEPYWDYWFNGQDQPIPVQRSSYLTPWTIIIGGIFYFNLW
jgi:TonB family protein